MVLPLIAIGGYEAAILGASGIAALGTWYYMPGGGREQLTKALNTVADNQDNTPAEQSEQAQQKAQSSPTAAAGDKNCQSCNNDDPCQGFRRQIEEHKRKLEDYKKNPYAYDNKNFLGQGRDATIIAARIRSLEHQIRNFEDQLKRCEEQNDKQ